MMNTLANAWCMIAWCADKVKAVRLPRMRLNPEMYVYAAAVVSAILLGWVVAVYAVYG